LALVLPPGVLRIVCDTDRLTQGDAQRRLAAAPSGTVVAAMAVGLGGRRRVRRLFRRAQVRVTNEYIVLPSWERPVVIVEDSSATLSWIWHNFATVPPGATRSAGPAHVAIVVNRRLPPRLLGALVPSRVIVGRLP
jgi:hypothetical protein